MSLVIQDVTKQFGLHTAVHNLSLTIHDGELFGLLGANGAGKTTTFRMILGILLPSKGSITWNEQTINYETTNQIGYLPEERGLYPKETVQDQLIYLAKLKGMRKEQSLKKLDRWLERFGIPEYKHKKVQELSKGNQQKIQFIAAVLHEPQLLILDEPFSGLDPVNVDLLKDAVMALHHEGKTIVFSSHRMDQVEEMCQNLCIIDRGQVVVEGSLRDVKRNFGKKHITVHADFDLSFLKNIEGVLRVREIVEGYQLQVTGEVVAQNIFTALQGKGLVRRFDLEEPSLHDIFVEKVGKRDG